MKTRDLLKAIQTRKAGAPSILARECIMPGAPWGWTWHELAQRALYDAATFHDLAPGYRVKDYWEVYDRMERRLKASMAKRADIGERNLILQYRKHPDHDQLVEGMRERLTAGADPDSLLTHQP